MVTARRRFGVTASATFNGRVHCGGWSHRVTNERLGNHWTAPWRRHPAALDCWSSALGTWLIVTRLATALLSRCGKMI